MASPLSIPDKSPATTSRSPAESTSSSSPPPLAPSSPRSDRAPPSPLSPVPVPVPVPAIHQAAQLNDLAFLDRYAHADTDVDLADAQGITALHWAAINGHLVFVRRLLSLGARVDTRGGELSGTPLMWAARNGHLGVVHLLLLHSSDPTLADAQSFNALHLAVHSSSPFLVAYLLFTLQPISVDTADEQGHSALAWACYQGDAISVELLLKAGASPTRPDHAGLTPLHWAVTKGNSACIRRIVEAGAELDARDLAGKSARDMAIELKNFNSYKRALNDAGFDEFGHRHDRPFKQERNIRIAIYAVVAVGMGVVAQTLSFGSNGWVALAVAMAECYGIHYAVTKVLLGVKEPAQSDRITKSNYLSAIIAASLGWVGWVWITRNLLLADMLPVSDDQDVTPSYSGTNFLFGCAYAVCCLDFYKSITLDPGHVPYSPNDVHLKETIEALVEEGKFNGMNFCLTCMVKRPLRSKHSYATGRCVGRFDHYCPWVWNDVGVNNHRQFLLFVSSLVVGVVLFIRLGIAYFSSTSSALPTFPDQPACSFVPGPICSALERDTFDLVVTVWAGLQLTWTVVLLGVQVWQVCRQVTTLEVSNLGRYGYMGGKPGISAPHQQGAVAKFQAAQQQQSQASSSGSAAADHRLNAAGTSGDADVASSDPASLSHAPSRSTASGGRPAGAFGFLLKLLGLDRFTSTHKALLHSHAHHGAGDRGTGARVSEENNPFDLGVRRNCLDFWTVGGQLRVDWKDPDLEIPPGGFKSRLVASGGGGLGRSTMAGASPYERVALEEV
ncbi:hypothetical protein JCM11491_002980 [Sporobolomyces phaffii]